MSILIGQWDPIDIQGPNSNQAAGGQWIDSGDPNPQMELLLFGGDTYIAEFQTFAPFTLGGGDTYLWIWWRTNATVGACMWQAEIKCITPDTDLAGKSFGTAVQVADTAADTYGEISRTEITFSAGAERDSIASLDLVRLRISRVQGHASDTLGAYAGFIHAALFEDDV